MQPRGEMYQTCLHIEFKLLEALHNLAYTMNLNAAVLFRAIVWYCATHGDCIEFVTLEVTRLQVEGLKKHELAWFKPKLDLETYSMLAKMANATSSTLSMVANAMLRYCLDNERCITWLLDNALFFP